MPDVTIPATPEDVRGYLARPVGEGPWPGVVVIQDALGLSDDIRQQADRLAAAGYLALAPDLYTRGGLRCVVATLKASRDGKGRAYQDISAARAWLASQGDCTSRIGIIGFCMGGGFALLCSPSGEFAASSVNYGEVPRNAERRLAGACPVVGSYGARDLTLRGRADRLRGALTALGVEHDVEEYPDAGHSFMNRINAGPIPGRVIDAARFGYDHPSSEDAWRRILDFFAAHLREA